MIGNADGRLFSLATKREVPEWLFADIKGPPVGYLHYDELQIHKVH